MLISFHRIHETVHKAETVDPTIPTEVVHTHMPSSSLTPRVVLVLNNLLRPLLVEKTPMPHMEATTITWQCGMRPWLNSSSN